MLRRFMPISCTRKENGGLNLNDVGEAEILGNEAGAEQPEGGRPPETRSLGDGARTTPTKAEAETGGRN